MRIASTYLTNLAWLVLAIACALPVRAQADVVFTQPPSPTGGYITSGWISPDGTDNDTYAWDSFTVAAACDITEIRWQAVAGPITDYTITIANGPILPDDPNRLARYNIAGTAGETYAGIVNGIARYNHFYVLTTPFHAVPGHFYWINIEGAGSWSWGLSEGSGGNGLHVTYYVGGPYFLNGPGDIAFTLIGTPIACTVPTITSQPASATICNWGSASFSVAATGTGTLTYQWRFGSFPIADGIGIGGVVYSGATTPTLTVSGTDYSRDAGNYTCVVSNSCGPATSTAAHLSINVGPQWQYGPVGFNQTVCIGGSASLTVSIWGTPTPTFQWQKNGVTVANGVTASGAIISGADTPTLTISNFQDAEMGAYRLVSSNSCGVHTSAYADIASNTSVAPTIVSGPSPASVCVGATASFMTTASFPPAGTTPTFTWKRNGVPLTDGPQPSGATYYGTAGVVFTVQGAGIADAGDITCTVANSCGGVTTNPARLNVSGVTISTQPVPLAIHVGQTAHFNTAASGTGTLTYQWRKDGFNVLDDARTSGSTTAALTIAGAVLNDAGWYDCIVTDSCDSAFTDVAGLSVTCPADVDDGTMTGTPDGGVTIDDLLYYLFIFDQGLIAADLDDGSFTGTPDGGVTIDDLLYFLLRFDIGC